MLRNFKKPYLTRMQFLFPLPARHLSYSRGGGTRREVCCINHFFSVVIPTGSESSLAMAFCSCFLLPRACQCLFKKAEAHIKHVPATIFSPPTRQKPKQPLWFVRFQVNVPKPKAAVLVMSAQVKAEPPPARSPVTVLQLWKKRPLLCLQACLLEFSKAKIFDHEGLLQQMQDHKAQVEAPPAQEPPPLQEARVVLRPILFIAVAAACVPEGELGSSCRESGRRMSRAPTRSSGRGTGSRDRGSCEAGSAAALPGSCSWFADLLPGHLA